jgi:RES domain-containing protein
VPAERRDRELLDTLDALACEPFEGTVWRVTQDIHDPTIFRSGGARWDDGTFDVLYTSLEREGALAEMKFHVARGQPVIPSRKTYHLHELNVRIHGVLDLTDWAFLERFGVGRSMYGRLPYLRRESEYTACQKIGEAVNFLGGEAESEPSGFIVPNARREGRNLVVLVAHVSGDDVRAVRDHGPVDWSAL